MGSALTGILYLVLLFAATIPGVLLGCVIGDGTNWIMNKILKLK